jgi:MFS family permease
MPGAVVVATLGLLVISLDSSVNIALPAMAQAFGIGPAGVRWVIICYVLTYALTAFAAGVVADRIGPARVFTAGLALTGLAFAAYAAAGSFALVLALRIAQGVGGGLVYGSGPALVTRALPRERHGRGLGVMSAGMGVGLTVGPLAGGLLVDALGWLAVFVYRAPLALALAGLALRVVGAARAPGAPGRLAVTGDIARAAVLRPLALAFLANYAQFAVWLLVPFYLVTARAIPPVLGGLLFALTPLGTAVAAPLAGWAADRLGPRWPALAGLCVEVAGLLTISQLAEGTPIAAVVAGLALVGLGVGVFQVANLAEMMTAFPRAQQGVAGGLAFLGRTSGSAVGVQVTGLLFQARLGAAGFVPAFRWAFLAAAAAAGLGLVLAAAGPRPARHRRPAAL